MTAAELRLAASCNVTRRFRCTASMYPVIEVLGSGFEFFPSLFRRVSLIYLSFLLSAGIIDLILRTVFHVDSLVAFPTRFADACPVPPPDGLYIVDRKSGDGRDHIHLVSASLVGTTNGRARIKGNGISPISREPSLESG
ncbi:uncharacterized protein BO80DRAFT_200809 [Aspergillus ibericus CBS 121593]|uniref:Uncharacterized protein n=1 Tax=Aspergillus ibericus CBS 121593 TaxID=1448316 RepID=A0A395GNY6_9EURO|nr:hypothetical protein BO80DRAFT_200809 [Aspergillus ibericus CBS 121593]RAK97046.1 hypothetical protein BO80DRAFT_200809 [Aspergillus ibericus CBS 121593]